MSLVEIAKVAGVSKSTVSRIINGRPGPSERTVRRVTRVMEQIGYVPKPPGRRPGLRRGQRQPIRTGSVAMLMLDSTYLRHPDIFSALVRGVAQALADNGLNMVFAHTEKAGQLPQAVRGGQVDGLLLAGAKPQHELLAAISHYPAVWLTSREEMDRDQVMSGNEAVGRLATEYLIARGHRRLAVLNPLPCYSVYGFRANAFRFVAQDNGVSVRVFEADLEQSRELDAQGIEGLTALLEPLVDEYLATPLRPTGLFIPDDRIAAAIYPLLHERGLLASQELDIISCGNEVTYLAGLRPRPATIDFGPQIMGRRAVEQLLWRLQHPGEKRTVQLAVAPMLVESDRPVAI